MNRYPLSAVLYFLLVLVYGYSLLGKFEYVPTQPWIRNYVADLLALPLMLGAARYLMSRLYSTADLRFSWPMILLSTAYVAFVFEWLLPRFSPSYRADVMDILCYAIGALGYGLWQLKLCHSEE